MSNQSVCRGVRGATTASDNEREAILASTRDLLTAVIEANEMQPEDVASVFFTMTADLNAEFPALAARQLGWVDVPLLCAQEIERPGTLERTIRILVHWNTVKPQSDIRHVYINGAEILRPDKVATPERLA